MQPEHRIDELIVDLSFTTTRLARHEKALLSEWLSEDLLPALDQLFSRYSPGRQVLRFETLEFDFGNLTNRNYQQSIREQLLQKFAQLLQTQLLAIVPTHLRLPEPTHSGDNPNARMALTQLFNYLASGQLSAHQPFEQPTRTKGRELTSATSVNHSGADSDIPKDSDTSNNAEKKYAANNPFADGRDVKKVSKSTVKQTALHEQLLDAVIAQHNIAELLRELPQRDLLIKRLLTQFPVPQRLELLRQLAPQQVNNAIALLDLLQFFESNAINVDAYQLDSNLVWQVFLQLGLEYPQATTEFWLNRIFRAISANMAIDVNLLQQQLVAIRIPSSSAATPLINLQTQIAQLSASENAPITEPAFATTLSATLSTKFADNFADKYIGEPEAQAGAQLSSTVPSSLGKSNSETSNPEPFNPELSNSEHSELAQSDRELQNREQFNTEQLRQQIASAFIRADVSQLQQLWPQLFTNQSQLLLAALEHYLRQAEIRQQLVLRLPLVLQADMIALLAPALKEVFLQLPKKVGQFIELFQAQTTILPEIKSTGITRKTVGLTEQSPELLLRQLWEIALGLIFNNQSAVVTADSVGDRDLFVMTLAARYADLHNLDTKIVQQAFDSLINQPLINHTQVIQPHIDQQQIDQPQINQYTRTNPVDPHERSIELDGNVAAPNIQQSIKPEVPSVFVATSATSNEPVTISGENHQQEHPDKISDSPTNSLSSVSDHQLFDLCLRLKSGALAWQSLANDIPLLQRLISSYIRLGHSATAENCADFVAAIEMQAESSSAPSAFYRAVLQSLIADKLIDLDAIALDVKSAIQSSLSASIPTIEAREEITIIENRSIIKDQTAQASAGYDVESNVDSANTMADATTPSPLDALAEQLQQGKRKAESLNLTGDQFAHLVDIFIAKEKTIASDSQADLIVAIHQQALQANNKTDYYRRILSMLVCKEILDLVQLCEQVNQQDIGLPSHTHPTLAQPTGGVVTASNNIETIDKETLTARVNQQLDASGNQQQSIQQNGAATGSLPLSKAQGAGEYQAERTAPESIMTEADSHQSNDQEIVSQFPSERVVTADKITSIVKTLLAESEPERWLQSLQLDLTHWQNLVAGLIQQTRSIDKDARAELTDAIQHQARQVIHPAHYYRLVIAAVIARKPIDLDVFTRAANSANEPIADQLVVSPPNASQPISSSITAVTDVKSIAQTLLTEPQSWRRVQALQFDNKQWETLATELIRQAQFNDQHAAAELIEAIQTQARVAITPAVYYRLVIQALLQQDPIDLEAFSATAIAAVEVEQPSPDSGDLHNIAREADVAVTPDNSIFQQPHQVDTGQPSGEKSNSGKLNNPILNTDLIDTASVLPVSISQNSIYSHQVNPDQAMDYPLLTGSDNSLRKPALLLAQLLAAELPLSQEQLLALQQHINALLNRSNPAMITEWCELLAVAQHAQVLVHSVPAHLLHQIALRLQTGPYTWLDALVKVVMEALALLVTDINNLAIKQAKWAFVFHYLFAADKTNSSTAETSTRALELSIELCEQLAAVTGIDDVQRLVNLTQRRIALLKPPAQQKPAMRLQEITTNPATHSDESTPQWEAGLHINNAGQVLAAAFLPRLFSMLNLMQDGKFIHLGAADRAVHLVQFMVTGQSTTPEYELVLNKILCGIGTSIPVSAGIDITEQEQTLIEQMLNSMIQHWKVLGSTSITGLRETFFQRQGWLVLEEDCWRLKVKEQTFDLLLDRLPWSISLIKHGWMDKPLRVSWRNHS